jgi:hypothetical protein
MPYTCPENHTSATADFCSVCGAEIGTAPAPAAPVALAAGAGEPCPTCGTPRERASQAFCEACGHNFRTNVPGIPLELAVPKPPPGVDTPGSPSRCPPGADPPGSPAPAAPAVDVRWDVVVRVDANLYGKPNPDAPRDQPPQTFTLFEAENMIGREGTGVRVQVPIRGDQGVSRRQALLVRQPDGTLLLRDLNSANGTQVNGAEVVPGADIPLRDGDTIAIGAWTRLAVRAVIS